jgi:hypothetical protein
MSKKLSELLGASEPLFSASLQQLERASGQQSIDVRLTAEIIAKSHQKMRELGLDPKFTNGRELYHALFGLVKLHDSFLAKKLGIKNHGNVQEVLRAIERQAKTLPVPQSVWAVKHSSLKKMLKTLPPKKVMKTLHYRSLDSMLKRESTSEILGGARFAEAPEWNKKFASLYTKLKPSDFEMRQIEVIYFDPAKWNGVADEFVKQTKHTVSHLKEMGAILLAPLPIENLPGFTITTLPFVLHYMNEIRAYSAYFKSQQIKPDFGEIVARTITEDPDIHAYMAGHGLHWRVIQRHYGRLDNFSEVFEPHLSSDDLAWHSAETALYKIEPALYFWHDIDFVGNMYDTKPVSFNLLDMAISCVNNLSYGYQSTHHMQLSLWHELLTRYLARPSLEHQVLKQLSYDSSEPSFVEFSAGDF